MNHKKKAIVSVINDLVTDQRVDKVCRSLHAMGFEVLLVGRRKKDSLSLQKRNYETRRMNLLFEKGPWFYLEYSFRLFFFLLENKARVLVSNDLDTLLPNFLASKIKRCPIVYDSHEYFTGVPELERRPFVRGIWKLIEKSLFPRLKYIFTVNESIAGLYQSAYGKEIRVLRNFPERKPLPAADRQALKLPENHSIIILQGAGINIDRGAEEAVLAMEFLENAVLLIIGGGDVVPKLDAMIRVRHLEDRVRLIPKQPMHELLRYTVCADVGLSLDKDTNVNYRFSLPNKLFDYIQAGVPVLASPLVEIKKIVEHYQIGLLIESHEPRHIASKLESMINQPLQRKIWKENLNLAASELCWENEETILRDVYGQFC